jgi:hypothetical protein
MPFSNESSAAAAFVQPTFLLQLKKVGKKNRSRTMLFFQLSGEFSRSFALDPGNGKLN